MAHVAKIIAHRGASADAPENTMRAFRLAFEQRTDGIELDIHLTRDGKIAVIHDDDTQRTGDVNKKVADQTFIDLRKINVGNFGKWKGKGYDEKIPTLDEVLAIVPRGKEIYIEIKVRREILPALEEILKRAPTTPAQTVLITFDLETAAAAKRIFPDRRVYWLVGKDKNKKHLPIDNVIAQAKGKVDGVDLDCNINLDAAAIKKIKAADLSCHVWTVDDPAKAKALMSRGVDSVITNRPCALRSEIKKLR